MSVKSWVLDRVQGLGAAGGRADLPERGGALRREPASAVEAGGTALSQAAAVVAEPVLADAEHLGVYEPLITALQGELQHFMASRARLHVVIAERDRFLLTTLGVRSVGGADSHALLTRFLREFRPEQVKRYLAREVIGRLPNAAVIDLGQFAGLTDLGPPARAGSADGGDDYAELLAALRTTPEAAPTRPFEVEVIGRWSEADTVSSITGLRTLHARPTPLAGRRVEFTVDDGAGPRPAALDPVLPGRRYTIGKDAGCDLRVEGTYTSRRHAELWLEGEVWHVADAGSTNGIRVERPGGGTAPAAGGEASVLGHGARVVLSARAEGPTADYPWIALGARPVERRDATPLTPITPMAPTAPRAPLVSGPPMAPPSVAALRHDAAVPTTVVHVRAAAPAFELTRETGGRTQALPIGADSLPVTIGRSRDQRVVIEPAFAGVSGRHLRIDALGDDGVHGLVEGDNGVTVDDVPFATGARFAWRPGQRLVLGGSLAGEAPCTLSLARAGGD